MVLGSRLPRRGECRDAFGVPAGGEGVHLPPDRNDQRDAADLADLLRMGRLPDVDRPVRGAGVAGADLLPGRLVSLRTSCRNQRRRRSTSRLLGRVLCLGLAGLG